MGLMLGAALAFAWAAPAPGVDLDATAWQRARRPGPVARAGVVLVALVALLDESTPFTFRGGILLASLATSVLVLGVVERPSRRCARSSTARSLRWVGERSYGLYLWHWPVILIVEADLPGPARSADGYLWSRLWCVVVTVAIADLSYRLIETPVRDAASGAAPATLLHTIRYAGTRTARAVWAAVAVLAVALTAVLLTAPTRTSRRAARWTPTPRRPALPSTAAASPARPPRGRGRRRPRPAAARSGQARGSRRPADLGDAHRRRDRRLRRLDDGRQRPRPALLLPRHPPRRPVQPAVGRGPPWSPAARRRATAVPSCSPSAPTPAPTSTGRGPPSTPSARPHGRRSSPCTAGSTGSPRDNAALRELAKGRDNVALADWDAALEDTTGQLQSDGIHPSLVGAHLYAKTIRQAFADLSTRHTGKAVTLKELPLP